MLQCVALCGNVLCCVVLQYVMFKCVAMRCSVLQCIAVCCIVLQCVSVVCCIIERTPFGRSRAFQNGSANTRSESDAAHMRKAPGVVQMRQTRQMQIDENACIRN